MSLLIRCFDLKIGLDSRIGNELDTYFIEQMD